MKKSTLAITIFCALLAMNTNVFSQSYNVTVNNNLDCDIDFSFLIFPTGANCAQQTCSFPPTFLGSNQNTTVNCGSANPTDVIKVAKASISGCSTDAVEWSNDDCGTDQNGSCSSPPCNSFTVTINGQTINVNP